MDTPAFQSYFNERFQYFIVDNIEEMGALSHDFCFWVLEHVQKFLSIYDTDGGYRTFLGIDPDNAYEFSQICEQVIKWEQPLAQSAEIAALTQNVATILSDTDTDTQPSTTFVNVMNAVDISSNIFYFQMIDNCVEQIRSLVYEQNVPPSQIAVVSAYLDDSLRFVLQTQLESMGIPYVVYRPSRSMYTDPAVKVVITLFRLLFSEWSPPPLPEDFAHTVSHVINELDPIRAHLLTKVVYRNPLSSFAQMNSGMQKRITSTVGQLYDRLREWLLNNQSLILTAPPDHIISKLFGELLSQPGYQFHTSLDAGRSIMELVNSAKTFRQTLYSNWTEDWSTVNHEFIQLVLDGIIAAHTPLPQDSPQAVFISPAYTFIMHNHPVDYQFWLDAGSGGWWERLEQPLTHPYVLRRGFMPAVWTDEMEWETQRSALKKLILGLLRRCHKRVYIGISEMSASGYEQRGPLLSAFQELMIRAEASR